VATKLQAQSSPTIDWFVSSRLLAFFSHWSPSESEKNKEKVEQFPSFGKKKKKK